MATTKPSSWQIEVLFRKAFDRTKDRFLSYIFVYLIGIAIFIALGIAALLLGGLVFVLYTFAKLPVIAIILGAAVAVTFLAALIYLGSWIQLSVLSVISEEKKLTVNETLTKTRPLVMGFIALNILTGLFMFGLFPFGILSLFIIFFLWGLWGSMAGFVYLYQKQPKGIRSLWISRQMVSQNFWGIAGRLILVFIAFYALTFLLTASKLNALTPILSLIFTPFVVSYIYEIYKNLSAPKAAKAPKVWLGLSIAGWAISFILLVVMGTFIFSMLGRVIQNNKKVTPYRYDQQFGPDRMQNRMQLR